MIKQGFVSGFVAGIVMIIIGAVSGAFTGPLYAETPQLWKPMEPLTNWLVGMWIITIIIGIIFGLVYGRIQHGIPGQGAKKGLYYGLILWLVGMVPGMMITLHTMAVPNILVAAWTIQNLVAYPLAGITISKIYEKLA
ncbi:MAG: hypothetical protein DRO11_05430 [Methanobacteriota archaeon]|nr:MAG: hypothetical protein DRO11_05430 [Euryarchaeota archaeon]